LLQSFIGGQICAAERYGQMFFRSDYPQLFGGSFITEITRDDFSACPRKAEGNGVADTTRATRNQKGLAAQ
jgi:hypothetical protein